MTGKRRAGSRTWLRWAGVLAVALIGAGIGASLLGRTTVSTPVGDVELTSRPALRGGATLSLAPLGSVDLPSAGPMRLQARLVALDDELLVRAGRGLARGEQPVPASEAARIEDEVASQIVDSVGPLALRTVAGGLIGAALLTLLVYRARREAIVGAAVGAVSVVALCTVAFTSIPDGVDDAQVNGAIGLLPQADPGLIEGAEGVQDYIGKTFRNIEGLYTGYVRSVAAGRIARTSDRVIAVSGAPSEDAMRRVAVLADSQGAKGVLWIVTDRPGAGSEAGSDAEPGDEPDESSEPDERSGPDAEGGAGDPTALGSGSEVPVVFIGPDTAAGFQFLDRFPVLVLGSDGTLPAGSTSGSLDDAALVVDPKGSEVPSDISRPGVSTGKRPSARGAGLTDASGTVRVTTGTIDDDRLEAVVISYGRNGPDIVQAQLVTVANGDIAVTRVLR